MYRVCPAAARSIAGGLCWHIQPNTRCALSEMYWPCGCGAVAKKVLNVACTDRQTHMLTNSHVHFTVNVMEMLDTNRLQTKSNAMCWRTGSNERSTSTHLRTSRAASLNVIVKGRFPALSHAPAKSASTCHSSPLVGSVLYIKPLFCVCFRYRPMQRMALAWLILGAVENLAYCCVMYAMSGLVPLSRYPNFPMIPL